MRNEILRVKTVWCVIPILIIILCLLFNTAPLMALSMSDYFNYSYNATFSKTSITGSESFNVTIVGTATCSNTLPMTVSEASIRGRIIAVQQGSGTMVTLNSDYVVNISPFPSRAGETAQVTKVVPLQFPAGTPSGTYNVVGEVIEAQVKALIWLPVTQYVPASQNLGTLTFTSTGGGGGGGGGGTPSTPTPTPQAPINPSTSDLFGFTDANGILTKPFAVQYTNNKCKLTINEGTRVLTMIGTPLSTLTIAEVVTPPPTQATSTIMSTVYFFGPTGAFFNPPINMTLSYDPINLPRGVSENSLKIAMWDANTETWVSQNSTVDTIARTVSASVPHFTNFAVLAYQRPGEFTVSELSINPQEVGINQEVTISVLVTNTGDLSGTYKADLKIGDAIVATKNIDVLGLDKQRVSFTTTKNAAGSYTVAIGGLSGSFVVKTQSPTPTQKPTQPATQTPAPTTTPIATPTATATPTPAVTPAPASPSLLSMLLMIVMKNLWLIGGAVAAVIIVGLIIAFVSTRRRY